MIVDWRAVLSAATMTLVFMMADRLTGVMRNRLSVPRSISSIADMPAHMFDETAFITTGPVQCGQHAGYSRGAVVGAGAQPPPVHGHLPYPGHRPDRVPDSGLVGRVPQLDVDGVAAQFALERVGCAVHHHPAGVHDGEPV